MSLVLSRRDLDFMLFEWLGVEQLLDTPLYAGHDRETVNAVLDLAEKLAEQYFAPANRIADRDEPEIMESGSVALPAETARALSAFRESGLLAASQPAAIGGGQLPFVIDRAAFAWLQAASPAISGYGLLNAAAANLLITHGSQQQIDEFAKPLLAGETFGTMCLSEPQAGSSLGDISTTAVPDAGRYRLFGNKMWISGADHNLAKSITHLVLARLRGASPGTKGLSLFLVPRDLKSGSGSMVRNDVVVAALNHKMGQRGTVNAALNFGEGAFTPDGEAGAIGYLIGSEGQGLSLMFTMMNEARIGVGMSAAAIGYTGFLHAVDYARTRLQGRSAGGRDPTSPPVPIIEHPDVRRMLLMQKSYVEGALALNLYCARLVDEVRCCGLAEERKAKELLLELLTPVAKSWPSEFCLRANSLAIQVHGGYGYTRDFPVEQFYRDNRLNAIHEGTNGIQALDLLGRKVTMAQGAALDTFAAEVAACCQAASELGHEVAGHSRQLAHLVGEIVSVTRQLHSGAQADAVLANASPYLDTFGHIVIGWMWLEQLIAAHGKASDFYDGKRAAARFFFRWELPQAEATLSRLKDCDRTVIDTPGHWL